jgi:competence ComEA-like helix-hairpin-helix protein
LRQALAQFYSPKELRALMFFLALGLASLIFRLLQSPAKHEIGFLSDPKYLAEARSRDSLFAVLAKRNEIKDSFYFYAPDTTDYQPTRRSHSGSSKIASLAPSSIPLNTASEGDLMKLPSVGEATAALIMEYRKERGRFRTLTEIMNVKGIGPKKFERMKPYLRLN